MLRRSTFSKTELLEALDHIAIEDAVSLEVRYVTFFRQELLDETVVVEDALFFEPFLRGRFPSNKAK